MESTSSSLLSTVVVAVLKAAAATGALLRLHIAMQQLLLLAVVHFRHVRPHGGWGVRVGAFVRSADTWGPGRLIR